MYVVMVFLGGCLGVISFILDSPFSGTLKCCAVITALTVILSQIKAGRILRVYCVFSSAIVFVVVVSYIFFKWYYDRQIAQEMGTSLFDGLQYCVIVLFALSHFVFASLFFLSSPPGGQELSSHAASGMGGRDY